MSEDKVERIVGSCKKDILELVESARKGEDVICQVNERFSKLQQSLLGAPNDVAKLKGASQIVKEIKSLKEKYVTEFDRTNEKIKKITEVHLDDLQKFNQLVVGKKA